MGFNYAQSHKGPDDCYIHFFLDDYQFERVWRQPDRYCQVLNRFAGALSPDFSLYANYSKAAQIYNHYRKHWLAAYWQEKGLKVIPTISWGDTDSLEWCFDGEPTRSTIAVSSIGTQRREDEKARFLAGYNAMLKALEPETILFYGRVPDGVTGNIVAYPAYHEKYDEVRKSGRQG